MGLTAKDYNIYHLLNDSVFIIPINQRKYIWNKNNWTELLEDIMLVYEEKTSNHFIGSIVLKKEKSTENIKNVYSIIDGQQRVLTLSMLMIALAILYLENNEPKKFEGLSKSLFVKDSDYQNHPIVSEEANEDIAKLVNYIYSEENIYKNLKITQIYKILRTSKNIQDCVNFFYENLGIICQTDINILFKIKEIIDEIRYIEVIAKEDEDAFTIFEILNARGKPLTNFELLRNFVLKYTMRNEHKKIYEKLDYIETTLKEENTIETFLKHYAIHKYNETASKEENGIYKLFVKNEKNNDINYFLNDLCLKAKYYSKIVYFNNCNTREQRIFKYFKSKRQQQFRPVLLGLMHKLDLKEINNEIYEKYIEYIYRFFICYHIIGDEKSNKIEDIVKGYAFKIENQYNSLLLETMKNSLERKLPSKEHFKNSLKSKCYSNKWDAYSGSIKRGVVFTILSLYEELLGYMGDFEKSTIEHIKPDSISEENVSLDNLVILEKNLNDLAKDKNLNEKILIYNNSKFISAKNIRKYVINNNFDCISRLNHITDTLYEYFEYIKEEEKSVA